MNPMCRRALSSDSISRLGGVKRRGLRLAPLFLLAVGGCVSLEQTAPIVSAGAGANSATLYLGRKIYTQQCTACHAAEAVSSYTAAQWATILPDMAERSKLVPDQAAAVRAYVAAVLRTRVTAAR
jgi:mono/diheme cytochrome c family protein